MSRKSLTVTVSHKGDIRKVETTTEVREELTTAIASVTLNAIADTYEKVITESFYILATFLQRVIARTPMDEYYEWTDENGHHKKHRPDKDIARYDWYITDNTRTVMSKELIEHGAECLEVDNQGDIQNIASYLIDKFGLKKNTFIIGNANEHAGVLEYGGTKWPDESEIKQGAERQHGLVNNHSIQAPVGMFRISLAELEEGIKTNSSMMNYKKHKTLTKTDYKKFAQILKQSGNIRTEDIERFVK